MADTIEASEGLQSLTVDPFPWLPIEIVCYVLEIAAQRDRRTALALARVSKVFKTLINPIIYSNVTLLHSYHAWLFLSTLKASKGSLGRLVRRLLTWNINREGRIFPDVLSEVICGCPLLECLVVDFYSTHDDDLLLREDYPSWPTPWQLVLTDSWLELEYHPGHPILQNVTHLHINQRLGITLETIAAFHKLTHLCLPWGKPWSNLPGDHDHISDVASVLGLSSLTVLLLLAYNTPVGGSTGVLLGSIWMRLAEIRDERLLVRPHIEDEDYDVLLSSGGTIWDGAEVEYKDWRQRVRADHN